MSTTPPPPPPSAPPPPAGAAPATCPNCGAAEPGDVFCEVCGFDFATGTLPAAAPPAPATANPPDEAAAPDPVAAAASEWTALVEADRAWYETNEAMDQGQTVDFPEGRAPVEVPLAGQIVQIGRRGTTEAPPAIDLTEDPGASRRHANLVAQPDGSWAIVDEGSTNGTRVRGGRDPIPGGQAVPLAHGDHIHLGAWTRITLRHEPTAAAARVPGTGTDDPAADPAAGTGAGG